MSSFAEALKALQQPGPTHSAVPVPANVRESRDVDSILHLRRTIGNRVGQQLLQARAQEFADASASLTTADIGQDRNRSLAAPATIQTILTINKPGDDYEQEADRVAEEVTRTAE